MSISKLYPFLHCRILEDGTCEKVVQPMINANGIPKGLKQVCQERFGTDSVSGKNRNDLIEMLEAEEDFKAQKPMLEEEVNKLGGLISWLPKFHPELSAAELVFRDLADFLCKHNIIGEKFCSLQKC